MKPTTVLNDQKDIPGTAVNAVLQRQYATVKATHDRVRDLRDTCKSC